MRRTFAAAAAAVMLSIFAGGAHASATSGELWINNPNPNDASIVPPGAPDATFATGAINYQSGPAYTIGEFLNNPVFNNQSAAFIAAGGASATADNIFLDISGTVGLLHGNNAFVVGHDDGAVMTVAGFGTVVSQPGPTGFTNTPFNVFNPGATGNFAFNLQYTECCGPPADLLLAINNVTVTSGVPEPTIWAMMLVGFGGLGLAMRHRAKSAVSTA